MEHNHDEHLQHYGVIGMKWGVRRGNASRAFAKASAKRQRLDDKATKLNLKSAKLRKKSTKMMARATSESGYQKARKVEFKANKLQLKSAKLQKKGMKWEKSMKKNFSNVSVKDISKEHLDAGRRYSYMLTQ